MQINVSHVAKLANLSLTDEELKKFDKQLSDVLQYIEKLHEVDTSNSIPTSQVTGLENVTRQDIPLPSLSQENALSNTTMRKNGTFVVEGILD